MSFLSEVQIPGLDKKKTTNSTGSRFLDNVVLPSNPQRANYEASLNQQATQAQRESANANSFGTIAKNTFTAPITAVKNFGTNLINGFVDQYKNPSPLEQTMEQQVPSFIRPAASVALRTATPFVEPFVTDAASGIIFKNKGLRDRLTSEIEKGNITPAGTSTESKLGSAVIGATQKTAPQVVGDTAQAVLSAYMPDVFGAGLEAFANKGLKQAITTSTLEGAHAGFLYGSAQAASSGSKDPKEIAHIILTSTAAGALLNLGTSAVSHGAASTLNEALSKVREKNTTITPKVSGGILDRVEKPLRSPLTAKQDLERLSKGAVSDNITDSAHLTDLTTPLVNDSRPTPLLLNKHNYDLITAKRGGEVSHENLFDTANNYTEGILIKTPGEKDKINLVKENPDGSLNVIGANRINGYGVITYFEQIDARKAKNYLESIRKRGESFTSTGGTATRLTEVRHPSSITPEGGVPASLSGVNPDETIVPNQTLKVNETLVPKGEGETATSKLASNVETNAIAKKLTDGLGELPEYKKMNLQQQAEYAADILKNNPEQAKRIALGQEAPPSHVIPEAIFTAVEDKAIKEGDVQTLKDLATQSSLSTEATAMGQRIRALGERDQDSPVKIIQDVQKAREANVKDVPRAKKAIVDEIKKEIKKNTSKRPTWEEFINEISCNY